nr:DUF3899 domain-containing protein [Listeria sp. PSOL-1]
MLIKERQVSLLHYINLSFLIAFIVFLFGLLIYVMRSGFLDRVHDGFRKVTRKIRNEEENEFSEMMLSDLVDLSYLDFLFSALLILSSSMIGLIFFYM